MLDSTLIDSFNLDQRTIGLDWIHQHKLRKDGADWLQVANKGTGGLGFAIQVGHRN